MYDVCITFLEASSLALFVGGGYRGKSGNESSFGLQFQRCWRPRASSPFWRLRCCTLSLAPSAVVPRWSRAFVSCCSVVALVLPTQMLVLPLLLASSLLDRPRSPTSRLAPPRAVTAECVMPSRGCFAVWASAAASVAFSVVSSSPRPHLLS
jgi:hypothetical protein